MKNGKIFFLTIPICLSILLMIKSNKKIVSKKPSLLQYMNRLDEFCINDIDQAKSEFEEFIELGLNPSDAFDLTIVKRVFI